MNEEKLIIRMADEHDAKEILAIYVPYIKKTTVTFEYAVPRLIEFKKRIIDILKKYPFIVAIYDNQIVGYAYASAFHKRIAYMYSVETSIYIKMNYRRNKIGRKLYGKLEEILLQQNIKNLYACIAFPNSESIDFHTKMGYKIVGHFNNCGYKFGEWKDVVWMEKIVNDHFDNPKPFISITETNNVF